MGNSKQTWNPPIKVKSHTHLDQYGRVIRCYHETKAVFLSWGFWVGVTFSFPLEHFLWEKVWPLTLLSKLLGL